MKFRLTGLPSSEFSHLFSKSDQELESLNVRRLAAESGFPCRITLRDATPGEPVLLLTYKHHDLPTPYRSSGPIFVRQVEQDAAVFENQIPDEMRGRLYSARAYDAEGFMIDADVAPGSELEPLIGRLFDDERAAFLHLHHARRGCYACRVDRA